MASKNGPTIVEDVTCTMVFSNYPIPGSERRAEGLSVAGVVSDCVYWQRSGASGLLRRFRKVVAIPVPCPRGGVKRLVASARFVLRCSRWLRRHSQSSKIWYAGGVEALGACLIARLGRRNHAKLVYEVADLPFINEKERYGWMGRQLERIANRWAESADVLVLASPYYWTGYYAKQIHRPMEVILALNLPEKRIFNSFVRTEHKGLVVGFVGQVRYAQQLQMLFEASSFVPGVNVLVAGSGPDSAEVARCAMDYSHVHLYGPYDYEKEIAGIYAGIDLVYAVYDAALLNVRLALPNRLYEAIVCGIPVVAAKGTALGAEVESLGIGFTVGCHDMAGLRCLLNDLVARPCLLEAARDRCYTVREDYFAEQQDEAIGKKIRNMMMTDD